MSAAAGVADNHGVVRRRWGILAAVAAAFVMLAGTAVARPVPRIVGGTTAQPGTWPFAAFVFYQDAAGDSVSCSGTVVAPDVVLTAAHCVTDEDTMTMYPVSGFTVVTGSTDVSSSSAQVSSVVQTVMPSNFTKYTFPDGADYSDALLQLATSTTAPAVALGSLSETNLYKGGVSSEIAGWGLTDPGDSDFQPTALQWAPTVLEGSSYCAQQDSPAYFDSADQLCGIDAPYDDTAFCSGDSGGPLVANDAGVWTELGVIVYSNCSTSSPGYDTNVGSYNTWINGWITEFQTESQSSGSAATQTPPSDSSTNSSTQATFGAPPTVTAMAAKSVGQFSATLSASLDPNGAKATDYFQWGTTTAYGQRAKMGSTGVDSTAIPVSLRLLDYFHVKCPHFGEQGLTCLFRQ